ncbi:aspartic peptidase domain-containing protein [Mycena epipterygia]|nr:aspartic peptidase domain-containing protein [Mycena epipterygia]
MSFSPRLLRLGALLLCAVVQQSCAVRMHTTRLKSHPRDSQTGTVLASSVNAGVLGIWATNVTINEHNFSVVIDTSQGGDLWVVLPSGFSLENTTSIHPDVTVQGDVGFASVQLGGYTLDGTFRIAVSNMTGDVGTYLAGFGLDGMISLGLNDLNASGVVSELLANAPKEDNFLGLSISRTADLEDSASASFMINEVDEAYAEVQSAPLIPVFPGGHSIWTVLIDEISVDGVNITLPSSTVSGTPAGKIVAVMEMSLKSGYVPSALYNRIYSQTSGAQGPISCNTTTTVILYIGGQPFPIHPLDLTDIAVNTTTNITTCTGSLGVQAGDSLADVTLGQDFMRNWYTVYNFGNTVVNSSTGNPTMQFLSITNSTSAAADVPNIRMTRLSAQAAQGPANMISHPGASAGTIAAVADNSEAASGDSDAEVAKYAPIIIGLLGANLLVVLILTAIGLVLRAPGRFAEDEARPLDMYDDKRYSD